MEAALALRARSAVAVAVAGDVHGAIVGERVVYESPRGHERPFTAAKAFDVLDSGVCIGHNGRIGRLRTRSRQACAI